MTTRTEIETLRAAAIAIGDKHRAAAIFARSVCSCPSAPENAKQDALAAAAALQHTCRDAYSRLTAAQEGR